MPTHASFRFSASHWSANVGSSRSRGSASGPKKTSPTEPSGSRAVISATPWLLGNVPVPMLAWMADVTAGADPIVALV